MKNCFVLFWHMWEAKGVIHTFLFLVCVGAAVCSDTHMILHKEPRAVQLVLLWKVTRAQVSCVQLSEFVEILYWTVWQLNWSQHGFNDIIRDIRSTYNLVIYCENVVSALLVGWTVSMYIIALLNHKIILNFFIRQCYIKYSDYTSKVYQSHQKGVIGWPHYCKKI